MGNSTVKDDTSATEGASNPEVVFNPDALVVDYLTALLTSTPEASLNSDDIRRVHLAMEAGWKLTGGANTVGTTSMNYDTECARMEAEILGIENKNLKFRTELAKIDAQVLRGENDNLKAEIARLKEHLNEVNHSLDTMRTENSEIKSMLESRQNQRDISATDSDTVAPQADTDLKVAESTDTERDAEVEPVVPVASADSVDDATDQAEEPQVNLAAQPDSGGNETVQELVPEPAPVAEDLHMLSTASSGIDPDTAIISRALVMNDRSERKIGKDVVINSPKRAAADTSIRSTKTVSKVIKQHHAKKHQEHQEIVEIVKAIPPNPVQHEKAAVEAVPILNLVPQHLIEEPEIIREDDPTVKTEALHLDGTEQIEMEQAPVPKVVVRRNVKNYEDLQNEAGSTNSPKTEHTVIL